MRAIKWFLIAIFSMFMSNMIVLAVDITVTDSSPYADVDGRCSLVEAIDNANDDVATHADCPAGSGADVIILNRNVTLDGSDIFSIGGDGATGLPTITTNITIDGNGNRIQRRNNASDFRILHVSAGGNLTLDNLTIRNGLASNNFEDGGGIANRGELTLITSVVEGNQVTSFNAQGGGIFNASTGVLTIIDSTIENNSVENSGLSQNFGGGIYNAGTMTLLNTTIANNSSDQDAGGIYTQGNTTITSSQITNNSADIDGGAMFLSALGGGATININNTVFSGNTAMESGGAIVNNIDGVEIYGSTFDDNRTVNGSVSIGGAIHNIGTMDITASTFSNNEATHFAGAIANVGFGTQITLIGSVVSNNSTDGSGGGLVTTAGEFFVQDSLIIGNSADRGGGLSVLSSNNPLSFQIERTTVMNNTAEFLGGGYYGEGNQTTSTIINSTFTGNSSPSGGGGIGLNSGGQVDLLNSTIADNTSNLFSNSHGGVDAFAGTMTIQNTIVANNTAEDCSATGDSSSLDNNITTGTGTATVWCSFVDIQPNDQINTDPLLDSLADNGNLGPTYILQAGSPAIDAIGTDCPTELGSVDQRGVPREAGTCDVGAIADADVILPEVYFETATTTIDDEGTVITTQTVNLVVDNTNGTLTAPGTQPLTVFVTQRGSATDALDYSSSIDAPLIFTFDAGSWVTVGDVETLALPINVIDDLLPEADETIEFEVTVIGPGVLIDDQSTHVVTIIDDDVTNNANSPVVAETAGAEELSEDAPNIGMFDPAISKIGFLEPDELGVRGESLRWDVTVINTSSVDGTNVVITDILRPELRINDVTTSKGQVSINGQTVTVTIPTLAVGEQVNITIFTTSLDGSVVNNTACVTANNQTSEECATALPVSVLPNTGQTPLWRNMLMGALLFLAFGSGIGFIRLRTR